MSITSGVPLLRTRRVGAAALLVCTALLAACGDREAAGSGAAAGTPKAAGSATSPRAAIMELRAVGMQFEGPREIPAGWTTFRFINSSPMTHFAIIDVPPADVDAEEISAAVMVPFQEAMDAMYAGDEAALDAAFGKFPPWLADLGRNGGPGLLSPGVTGETTVFLAPGRYVIECYVKRDGIFHSTPPSEGQLGMLLELTVTGTPSGAPEPTPTATVNLSNGGIELVDGQWRIGRNTIRVNFIEQQALPSFTGNDVHLLRVDSEQSMALANDWMDWRKPEGLQDPSPVMFLGGMQDLPAGRHGYFSVDLAPGDYALMGEVPDPQALGLVMPFSVR